VTRRPRFIRCAACGLDKPAKGAREYQGAWCRAFDGEGSHTDPQKLDRTGIVVCRECYQGAEIHGEELGKRWSLVPQGGSR
jgi:hypothetical protein